MVSQVHAQKIKIVSGDKEAFKDARYYHITFDFDNIDINYYHTEEAYLEARFKAAEEEEAGSGEASVQQWHDAPNQLWIPKFMDLFNKWLPSGRGYVGLTDQTHSIHVVTRYMEFGYWKDPQNKGPAIIDVTITIKEIANPQNELVLTMDKVKGVETMMSHVVMTNFERVAQAYARCGRELAKYLGDRVY